MIFILSCWLQNIAIIRTNFSTVGHSTESSFSAVSENDLPVSVSFMEDRGKEGARRVTEVTVKMCTHRRRSNRQETTNGVDSKHRVCL